MPTIATPSAVSADPPTRLSSRVVWGLIALGLLLFFLVLPHGVDGVSVLWTQFVGHPDFSWRYPVVIAYAAVVIAYVAWPLFRQWTPTGYRDLALTLGRSPAASRLAV